ncbi:hypothetical protein [Spirochaeta isovalerica]|uniref:2,4-dienoyl-CoA reductase-like NADH-dependent reductase (Old Yellow Enzyme family) n=1 Tax=Spirochaeta isovalerica TaxID=150 RepID=A0A841R8M8_9SPIO|nr:hypothetical protein [Spirochaeta isovalerica]MBB6481644.1 2,4-dienoyl-CoA reductase-like NADH-dependent reductase (Old Yellow Enzyme family) [Spirochaeta isovalerica]
MKSLHTPLDIHGLKIPNRIVMAPLATWFSDESGKVNEKHLKHYGDRKGPGLMIVEATTVSPEGRLSETQLGLFDDNQIEGHKKLAALIESNGSVPGIQIHHAGGKATVKTNYGLLPLVPSRKGVKEGKECRELTVEDIHRIQRDFARAAERAVESGYKYIELHGAHGYLGTQFLSPLTNKRTDGYGGSLSGRQRFILELFSLVEKAVNGRALVSIRLGAAEKEGLTLEEGIDTAEKLKAMGIKIVNISSAHSIPKLDELDDDRFSPLLNMGANVKRATGLTVIGVGGIKKAEEAVSAVETGLIDMVAVGKAILCDPRWAERTLAGKGEEIELCIGCRPCKWFTEPEKCPVRVKREKAVQ